MSIITAVVVVVVVVGIIIMITIIFYHPRQSSSSSVVSSVTCSKTVKSSALITLFPSFALSKPMGGQTTHKYHLKPCRNRS
jgi:hypothetical protein